MFGDFLDDVKSVLSSVNASSIGSVEEELPVGRKERRLAAVTSLIVPIENDKDQSSIADRTAISSETGGTGSKSRRQGVIASKDLFDENNNNVSVLSDHDLEEIFEQRAAQIAALACEIPAMAIDSAIYNATMVLRKKPKTLYDYNLTRKRDFHILKETQNKEAKKMDSAAEDFERHGKASYGLLQEEPTAFLRDYKYDSFTKGLKLVHPKLAIFQKLHCIDLAGQLIGDEKMPQLCELLPRCPLSILILSVNSLTDVGIKTLSRVLRSLPKLDVLNLSGNNISDDGVEDIFNKNNYSPILREINLSRNPLTYKGAFFLGEMFKPGKQSALDSLYLGGKVGKKGWGDEFVRVLISFLCMPNARSIKILNFPEAGLTQDGIAALSILISCSTTLEKINLSKNDIVSPHIRIHLTNSLRVNHSIRQIFVRQCGLTAAERNHIDNASTSNSPLTWHEASLLAYNTAKQLYDCEKSSYSAEIEIRNNWQKAPPMPWPTITGFQGTFYETENFTNFSNARDILPPIAINIIDCFSRIAPLIDTLLVTCEASEQVYKENLKVYENPEKIKNSSKALSSISNQINNSSNNSLNELRIQQSNSTFLISEAAASEAALAAEDEIKRIVEECALRRKNVAAKREVLNASLDQIMTSAISSSLTKNSSGSNNNAWGKTSKSKKKNNVDVISMASEDFYATVMEYSVSLEVSIATYHKLKIQHNKYNYTGANNNDGSGNSNKQEDIANIIPYYSSMGLAACYTHFFYVFLPAEQERQRKSLLAFERDKLKREAAEMKILKVKNRPRVIGKRFEIRKEARQEMHRNSVIIMDKIKGFKISANDDKKKQDIENHEHLLELELEKELQANKERLKGLLLLKKKPTKKGNEDEELNAENSDDDDDEEDDEEEDNIFISEPTRFKPSIAKREALHQIAQQLPNPIEHKKIEIAFCRTNRRFNVRKSEVPGSKYCFLDETERSEAFGSLYYLNTIRTTVDLEDRILMRRKSRLIEREEKLR